MKNWFDTDIFPFVDRFHADREGIRKDKRELRIRCHDRFMQDIERFNENLQVLAGCDEGSRNGNPHWIREIDSRGEWILCEIERVGVDEDSFEIRLIDGDAGWISSIQLSDEIPHCGFDVGINSSFVFRKSIGTHTYDS